MKKIVAISVVIFFTQGVKAAFPVMRQGMKIMGQVRSIAHGPTLVRLNRELNAQDRPWFAFSGALALYNGTLAQALQAEETKKVTSRLFNQHPGEPIRFTIAPGNPAIALNAELISELIAMRRVGKINLEGFVTTGTFKEWKEKYKGDEKKFRSEVRRLIKELNELEDEKAAQLLSAALYYKSHPQDSLVGCAKKAGLSVKEEKEELSVYDDLLIKVLESRNSLHVSALMPEEIPGFKNRCAEKSLWAIVNLLLYNPDTGKVELSVLPSSVQNTCNPRFAAFLRDYPTPSIPGYYEKAHKEFLSMVEDLPFIKYEVEGKGAPVYPSAVEIGKLLQYFFGTYSSTCKEICAELQEANSARTLECIQDTNEVVKFLVTYKDDAKKNLSGTLQCNPKHAFFVFDTKETFSVRDLTHLAALERREGHTAGTYVKVVPGYIHRLHNWEMASPDDLVKIIEKYSLTLSDLEELSPGLGFYQDGLVHTIVSKENVQLLHFLLKMGCKTSLKNSGGYTPRDYCLEAFNKLSDEDHKKYILMKCIVVLDFHRYKEMMVKVGIRMASAFLLNCSKW